jgi:hypothetical protein
VTAHGEGVLDHVRGCGWAAGQILPPPGTPDEPRFEWAAWGPYGHDTGVADTLKAAVQLASAAMERLTEPPARTAGDDVVLRVRVRKVNLPRLEEGVELGLDLVTAQPIELRLVPRDDGTHDLQVITADPARSGVPDPVDVEEVHQGGPHAGR